MPAEFLRLFFRDAKPHEICYVLNHVCVYFVYHKNILRWLSRRCSSAVSKPTMKVKQKIKNKLFTGGFDTPSAIASGYSTTED